MQKQSKDKTYGLKEHSKKRNEETFEKVNQAIERIKRSKTKKITFQSVAKEAGVAVATLYNNSQIKERIQGLRALEKDKNSSSIGNASPSNLPKDKMKQLYEEIRKLKQQKQDLIVQLVDFEEIKDENKRLREQLDKVVSLKN